jgi:predicted AlkP superfamily phosphohydrolase/phosphomutase
MNKVLVIGIDALDSVTLSKLYPHLQNFRKLKENTPNINFDGVFPPDSPTSWGSIYTGLNPAKHGIVLFTDPLQRVNKMISNDVDDSTIHRRTFWDIAGKMGKKVCILPHLLGYPAWQVNGIMIGRSGVTKDVQVFPQEISKKHDLSQFKWALDLFPGRDKKKYIETARDQILREMNFSLEILKNNEWDLFFVSFGELDTIQYSFWNYYDEMDPSYPGNNQYENVIIDFYKIYDDVIGKFLSSIDPETIVIIVSDHGIGSRPVKLININELFRRKSFLTLKNEPKKESNSVPLIIQLKRYLLKTIDKYDLGNMAAIALRMLPKGKDWFIASNHIDWENSMAYLTDQSGIKNYPYGGIVIKRNIKMGYEELRNIIIKEILQFNDPVTGENIVKWICKREELYEGEYIDRYPDIIFELRDDYGAGTTTPAQLFDKSLSHNIAPGCHKQHHSTFLISGVNNRILSKNDMNLMDVTPTILDLLGIDWENRNFDGKSIFK